jgi:hypothetical protein
MKKRNLLKLSFLSWAILAGGSVFGQCELSGLDSVYCADDAAVTMTGTPVGGTFSGSGVTGDQFDPVAAGPGDYTITYDTDGTGDKFYLRAAAGEPWSSASNTEAMDAAFGPGEWTLGEFESVDVDAVFSETTQFVFIDGSDNGALELDAFLTLNITAIEEWVEAGGHLLLNAAPNEGTDMAFGFGGTILEYGEASGSVDVVNTNHPAYLGPLTPTAATMTGSAYSHAHITGSGYSSLLVNSTDATNIVLCEKPWGAGWVMMGGMTTSNFHSPSPQADNWRANLLTYMNDVKSRYYLRASVGEPWFSSSNTDAMDNAFGANLWTLGLFEDVVAEDVFRYTTGVVFIDGSDSGAEELATFLDDNIELIEAWVHSGGSLLLNAAPNEGGDIDFGFDGSTLVYDDASSSVDVVDLSHPAYLGPLTPTASTMTGGSYSHAHITGTGFTNVLVNSTDATNVVLCEKTWGEGMVMMGGMTTSNFHSPSPQGDNWRANLLSYIGDQYDGFACSDEVDVTVLEPLVIDYAITNAFEGGGGAIDATITGGMPVYVFDWDNDGTGDFDDTEDLADLAPGTYTLVVEDEAGCTASEAAVVGETMVGIVENGEGLKVAVYPNPTNGLLTVACDGQFTAQVIDLNGRILNTVVSTDLLQLDLESVEAGVYFIFIQSGELSQTVKVLKN